MDVDPMGAPQDPEPSEGPSWVREPVMARRLVPKRSDFFSLPSRYKAAVLGEVGKCPERTTAFLRRNTSPVTIDVSGTEATVDGHPARRHVVSEQVASGNDGIYMFERDGQPRVLKVLRATTNEDVVTRLRGNVAAEILGGPRVHGISRVGGSIAIELERAFPDGEPTTLKDLAYGDTTTAAAEATLSMRHGGRTVLEQMFDHLLAARDAGITPLDTDFIIAREGPDGGAVRWLDADAWFKQPYPWVRTVLDVLETVEAAVPSWGRRSLAIFLESVQRESPAQLDSIIEEMAWEPPHRAAWIDQMLALERPSADERAAALSRLATGRGGSL